MRKVTMMLAAASMFTMTMTSFAFADGNVVTETLSGIKNIAAVGNTYGEAAQQLINSVGNNGSELLDGLTEAAVNKLNKESVKINDLHVESENVINGSVTADGNSRIAVGQTTIQNTEANKVEIYTDNQTQALEAKDGSTISIGEANIKNFKGNKIYFKTRNRVNGKVTATDHSVVEIGGLTIR